MRTKFAMYNGIIGIISQFFIILLGFITRAIFIRYLGDELLGINGTLTNVLSILSVTELGVGSAITFCLYKPVYAQDKEKIAGIMNLFKKAYTFIGITIFVLALCVTPFLHLFLKGYTLDLNYIRLIFVLYSFNSVISYFLGYCRTMIFASQENYIVTSVDFITKILLLLAQIAVLKFTQNYIFYLLLITFANVSSNLVLLSIYYKKYPYLKKNKDAKVSDEDKKEIIHSIKYLSISSFISVGVFGTDNLLISTMIGVITAAIYSSYSLIITSIQNMFTALLNGVIAGLGNLIAEGNNEKINDVFNLYDFSYFLIASFTSVSLFILMDPFITDIWIRKESYRLALPIVCVLVLNSYMTFKRQPIWQYQNVAGIFKDFLPYSFLELILNLVFSIILALKFDLIGIFLGTTVAYICSWLGQIYVVHKKVLFKSHIAYYMKQVKYMILTLMELILVIFFRELIVINNVYLNFAYLMLLCAIIPNGFNYLIYHNTKEFKALEEIFLGKLIRKRKKNN